MSRLRGITFLLVVGLGQAGALGAPPEPAAAPEKAQKKAPEKVEAIEYVKAGAYLYNKGQVDKASRYFKAADRYRSQLTDNEEIVLEVYLEEVENYYKKRTVAPRVDPAVATPATTAPPAELDDAAIRAETKAAAPESGALPGLEAGRQSSRYDTTDPKQRARWLLNESREQMGLGNYELAAKKIAEADALDVKWHFLEETPEKAAKLLQKVRAKSPHGPSAPAARALGVRAPDSNLPQTGSGAPNR